MDAAVRAGRGRAVADQPGEHPADPAQGHLPVRLAFRCHTSSLAPALDVTHAIRPPAERQTRAKPRVTLSHTLVSLFALLGCGSAGVPHEVVGDELSAPFERFEQGERPVGPDQLEAGVYLDHG